MQALILAGGYGTRLGELTRDCSKVLLPVAGRPMIEWVLERAFALTRVDRAVIVTNDRFFADFRDWRSGYRGDRAVTVLNDGTTTNENRLGAVGDVLFAIEHETIDDDLLIMAGDNIFDFDLQPMADLLTARGSCAALYDVGSLETAKRYSNATLDDQARITAFVEKPPNPSTSAVVVALYMYRAADLALFKRFSDEGHNLDLIGGFLQWAHRQTPVYGCTFGGRWWDIGDRAEYDAVNEYFARSG
ncbi:MAG: nucleotidyltransferase family protein [Chloroflexota bacterium]|nr:nucleotidyltransferase family protein [Chloroflexota bacterium]